MDVNALSAPVVTSPAETTWLVPLIASAIGALIGGGMALLGVIFTHRLDLRKQKRAEEQALQNLYRALRTEFSEMWTAYNDLGAGAHVESLKDGEALMDDFGALRPHFTIYRSSSILIGCIRDDDLRESLVKTYAEAQILMDAYNDNKILRRDFKDSAQRAAETQEEEHAFTAKTNMEFLRAHTKSLKAYHDLVKAAVKLLDAMLEKHIKPV